MANPASPPRLVRIGVLEIDVRSGELRKSGLKIKLQEQPFQILAMLLERPGELVTREELQKKLWPADTFVDFEHAVNKAVNKIREALGDSADTPRYVETLPRRGYRFIVPIEWEGVSNRWPCVSPRYVWFDALALARVVTLGALAFVAYERLRPSAAQVELTGLSVTEFPLDVICNGVYPWLIEQRVIQWPAPITRPWLERIGRRGPGAAT